MTVADAMIILVPYGLTMVVVVIGIQYCRRRWGDLRPQPDPPDDLDDDDYEDPDLYGDD